MNDDAEENVEVCEGWTHAGKVCKCWKCETVARCTEEFDFYSETDGELLECENCFRESLKDRGIKLGPGFKPVVDSRN